MDIEQALKTAIEFEVRVLAIYTGAKAAAPTNVAKRIFALMADEERSHVEYLEHTLKRWQESQELLGDDLKTALPDVDEIRKQAFSLATKLESDDKIGEVQLLEQAREVEIETGNYYKKMVKELPAEGRAFFQRFVEIEEGHLALVEAEIDAVNGDGFWFDMPEFNLENA